MLGTTTPEIDLTGSYYANGISYSLCGRCVSINFPVRPGDSIQAEAYAIPPYPQESHWKLAVVSGSGVEVYRLNESLGEGYPWGQYTESALVIGDYSGTDPFNRVPVLVTGSTDVNGLLLVGIKCVKT